MSWVPGNNVALYRPANPRRYLDNFPNFMQFALGTVVKKKKRGDAEPLFLVRLAGDRHVWVTESCLYSPDNVAAYHLAL